MPRAMRFKTYRIFRAGKPLLAKLGLGVFILGLAGPALGGREAPAVWVPLAPAVKTPGAPRTPMVLVPWSPEYLAAPVPGLLDGAVRSGVLPRGVQQSATGPSMPSGTAPERARSLTFSDVIRDVDWRRHTAKRLRQAPSFKPSF